MIDVLSHQFICLFDCMDVRPSYFLQSIQGQMVCYWVYYSCYKPLRQLLMKLSNYFHPGYGKKNGLTLGSNSGPPECEPSTLPMDQSEKGAVNKIHDKS